ncbi:Uncharacterised protein [Mycobacteroides abscessus subsp. abscessus]|nr:Uncharacterised protein [Mycobacteroides abscessus subsp. abscessus]
MAAFSGSVGDFSRFTSTPDMAWGALADDMGRATEPQCA